MSPMETIVREARAHRTVMLRARERDGSVEPREVEPYSLRDGGALLYCFCLKRNDTRCFRVERIIAAAPTGRTFTPRWPVEL